MTVVPRKEIDKVTFYETHIAPWSTNAATLRVDPAAVTDLETKTTAARDAYRAQVSAQQKAKDATAAFRSAVKTMATAGSSIITQIRATADVDGDSIYQLAEIPAPAAPSPKPAPGTPYELKTEVDGNGALLLSWKCDNPAGTSGTIYQVYRSTNGSLDFEYLGGVGSRKFVDATVPAGATQLTYKMQAVRSTAAGMWATFNVLFGSNVAPVTAVTGTQESPALKMAA
jgi:hypothetical protein